MNPIRVRTTVASVLAAAFVLVARAEAPHVYAITGARIVTAAGAPIDSGTIVVRGGFVESVGVGIAAPADAVVIDGKGLNVYPGLIDMGTALGLAIPPAEVPRDARTLMELERARRLTLLRPQLEAAQYLRSDSPELKRLASAGITAVLATPPGDLVAGRSSLVTVVAAEDAPQIGNVADERRGLYVVKTPVALHVSFSTGFGGGGTYPASLMGGVSFVRQAFLDAGHYQLEQARYERVKGGTARPVYDAALDAMQPALAGRVPVVFQAASALDIRRALLMAKEFKLDPVLGGGLEADQAVQDIKAVKARVIYSLNFPVRSRLLAPDADEPIQALRARANAPKVPSALESGGVMFAFSTSGLSDPRDFVRNAARAVKAGLPPDAAVRAMTISAATIAGAADRIGSLERGKIANLIVTDGDLFDERMTIRHVFVDGRLVPLDTTAPAQRRR